jgi:DNA-binding response OmpR family regulator
LSFADLKLDPVARTLVVTGRPPITLGAQKCAVLTLLMRVQGESVTAERLTRWTGVTNPGIAVHDLARRLERAGSTVVIVNDHGRGWQLLDALTAGDWLSFADLKLDPVARTLAVSGQAPVTLAGSKAALLELLIRAEGGLVGAADVSAVSAGTPAGAAVIALRRRLGRTGTAVTIVTERGRGWRLQPVDSSESLTP